MFNVAIAPLRCTRKRPFDSHLTVLVFVVPESSSNVANRTGEV